MESNIIALDVTTVCVKDVELKREYPAGRQQGIKRKWSAINAGSKPATLLKL
jgi:hypothetical protein